MKKFFMYFVTGSLLASGLVNAQVSKMRAIQCALPYFYQKFRCNPEEQKVGRKWLIGASIAAVVTGLAALGLSRQRAYEIKKQMEQEAAQEAQKESGLAGKKGELTEEEKEEAFEKATIVLRTGVEANQPFLVEEGLKQGARATGGFEKGPFAGKFYLDVAAEKGNAEMVRLLLKYGADPELSSDVQTTEEIIDIITEAAQQPRIGRPSWLEERNR